MSPRIRNVREASMAPSCSPCHGFHSGALDIIRVKAEGGTLFPDRALPRWESRVEHVGCRGRTWPPYQHRGRTVLCQHGHFGVRECLQTSVSPGWSTELCVRKAVFSLGRTQSEHLGVLPKIIYLHPALQWFRKLVSSHSSPVHHPSPGLCFYHFFPWMTSALTLAQEHIGSIFLLTSPKLFMVGRRVRAGAVGAVDRERAIHRQQCSLAAPYSSWWLEAFASSKYSCNSCLGALFT